MSIKRGRFYECDRCGKFHFIEDECTRGIFTEPKGWTNDFCPECNDEFKKLTDEFMNKKTMHERKAE